MAVLIIDDDVDINILAKVALEAHNHKVFQAYDGYQGVEIANKYASEIKIIILDIMMPGLDGFEVLTILKQKKRTENIPVIFLSARKLTNCIISEYDKFVVKFIAKPFEISEFINTIEMFINKNN